MYPSMSDLLVDYTKVFQNVFHAVFHQPLTGVELSKTVNSYTVLYIHVTLYGKDLCHFVHREREEFFLLAQQYSRLDD